MRKSFGRREFLKVASLLSLASFFEAGCTAPKPSKPSPESGPPNVLILVFDTLSARHLSLHGYRRDTAPNMTEFAHSATVYHAHYATGNFTVPSTASFLSGSYPWSHRAFHHAGIVSELYKQRNLFKLFSETHNLVAYPHNLWADLLIHQFQDDIDTYIKTTSFNLINDVVYDRFSDKDIAFRSFEDFLLQEFDASGSLFSSLTKDIKVLIDERVGSEAYAESFPRGIANFGRYNLYFLLEDVIQGVVSSIERFQSPFMAYLHFFPPHEPYCPRREFIGIFEDGLVPPPKPAHVFSEGYSAKMLNRWRTQYDEYIAYTDAEFGRLLAFLQDGGYLNNSYVILTSDHGQLFERGVHGHVTKLLYEPVIRVPLIISEPGQQHRQDVYTPTSCVDILPTLLHLFGRDIPAWCEGKPLPNLAGATGDADRSVFSLEAKTNPAQTPLKIGTLALIRGRHKLIQYFGHFDDENVFELYDLENDPEELEDLYPARPRLSNSMKSEMQDKINAANLPFE